jgi:hypothetical protein
MGNEPPLLRRATHLAAIPDAVDPRPLVSLPNFREFYCDRLNQVRGSLFLTAMESELRRSDASRPFKALLKSHEGAGKSTELTRVLLALQDRYEPVRFSVQTELDPNAFLATDVLLLMLLKVAERADELCRSADSSRRRMAPALLRDVMEWYAVTELGRKVEWTAVLGGEAAAGPAADSWLAKLLGIAANVRGELRYAAARSQETKEYRLRRVSGLLAAANRLLDECRHILADLCGKQWLFVGEDFDKKGIPHNPILDFYVRYGGLLRDLDAHWVFTVPIALANSELADQLPVPKNRIITIHDVMVFRRDRMPCQEGRAALAALLDRRVDPALFAPGQQERLVVASGGNVRDLFFLTNTASLEAQRLRHAQIGRTAVDAAIRHGREVYEKQLGEALFDAAAILGGPPTRIGYEQKVSRLISIYRGDPSARVPDPVLYSLFRSRAVLEFNGDYWLGVHPLVVDVLAKHGHMPQQPGETYVPGGTE